MKDRKTRKLNIKEYQKFGTDVFGPFLLAYSHWMYKNITKANITKVFCLSRDGYMMKRGLELIAESSKSEIDIKYFYCSRKSLIQALICNASSYEESLKYLTFRKIVTVSILLEFYGFTNEEILSLEKNEKINIAREIKFEDIKNDKEMQCFYEKYKEIINDNSRKQSNLFLRYLSQMNFSGKVAIADIGWHGSMQYYLEQFCLIHNVSIDIMGLYIGYYSFLETKGKKLGFLFDDKNLKLKTSLLCFFGVLEKLFQSTEGSTDSYFFDCQKVEPLLSEYEYSTDDDIVSAINILQDSSVEYVKENVSRKEIESEYYNLVKRLLHFGKYPKMKDVELFSFFYNYDGEKAYFVSQKPIWDYSIMELKHKLVFSAWKTGFLKSLFKVPFPYYIIYKVVA